MHAETVPIHKNATCIPQNMPEAQARLPKLHRSTPGVPSPLASCARRLDLAWTGDAVATFRVGPQIAGQLCLADVDPEAATWLEAFRVRSGG